MPKLRPITIAAARVLTLCVGLPIATLAAADEPADPAAPTLAAPANAPPLPATIEFDKFLVLPAVGNYGRLPLHQDAVEAQLVAGDWQPPGEGNAVELDDGKGKVWESVSTDSGTLDTRMLRGGYAWARFDSPAERVWLLEATGHAAVYVNGEVRTGDPYGLGWLRLPVLVKPDENTLLFHLAGERLSARLTAPPADVFFLDADHTLPTLVRGEQKNVWAAVPVVNATRDWLRDVRLECQRSDGARLTTPVEAIAPLSVRKLAFQIPAAGEIEADDVELEIRLIAGTGDQAPLASTQLRLECVGPTDTHVRTFRSQIDGSVQPYAVRPATLREGSDDTSQPGMIVTLHDAGVDCRAHIEQYQSKDWAHIVAPQGRRPYGFDWEDWGRIDALEAIADAREHYPSEPRRTYLTGHGMGGHGTWHLGVTYPDRFAAIAPSAAWPSFWSYGGGMPSFESPDRLESLLLRGYAPSDTVELLSNLADVGIYVLHGERDPNVPVEQARFMRGRLAGFHTNFAYYENPDAAGWMGDEQCDWPPLMQFFQRQTKPTARERAIVDFTTVDPGISSRCDWLVIEAQQEPLKPSRTVVRRDLDTRTFVVQTTNIARLAIDVSRMPSGQPYDVVLDGQQHLNTWPADSRLLRFERVDNDWRQSDPPSPRLKGPVRNGLFKSAFDHGAMLVYGTVGSDEENRWASAKARYDAETFWYRGGSALEVVPDQEFDAASTIGRSVILYGNADTNSAWAALLSSSPVQIHRGEVRVGERIVSGDDLAVLMVYPRGDSDAATIGVVAGTGLAGMAATNRCRYFVSGIAYPDLLVFGADTLTDGTSAIRAWGYFGPDWAVDTGEIAWRDMP